MTEKPVKQTLPLISKKTLTQFNPRPKEEVKQPRFHPISDPVGDPWQHRAIGLVLARWYPAMVEGVISRNEGLLICNDRELLDGVQNHIAIPTNLLGRTMSLVNKHKEEELIFVVYPRTNDPQKQIDKGEPPRSRLFFQITGIWSPALFPGQKLGDRPIEVDIFSIRGQCTKYSQTHIWIKIIQSPNTKKDRAKEFKLMIEGKLPHPIHKFWDLKVKRIGDTLVLVSGEALGVFNPPRKPGKKPFKKGAA